MAEQDLKNMLTTITGEADDSVLSVYLELAKDAILGRLYPFGYDPETIFEVPSPYEVTQVNIAAYLINKRGAEGESAHRENGVSRTYEDGGVPASMLRGVVPLAKVPVVEASDEASAS